MILPFVKGDKKTSDHIVTVYDTARFPTGEVHSVYSTFALARDAEWSGRLFVLEMKENDEEGIGTEITAIHLSPALIGDTVIFTSTFVELIGNEITTTYEAKVKDRLIATGTQKQKILKKEKLEKLFATLRNK